MSKYALFTGCTARTNAPELLKSVNVVAKKLDIELVTLDEATCCGAMHLQDYDEFMGLVINARNIAYAEKLGLHLMTICNTCQLVLSEVNAKLKSDERLREKVNKKLAEVGLEFKGSIEVCHFLSVIIHDIGTTKLEELAVKPFTNFNIAPFYGCHGTRPNQLSMKCECNPPFSARVMEDIIHAIGGNSVSYQSKHSCCGFHVDLQAPKTATRLTGNILTDAIDNNADMIVTPCPLCQLNLDVMQKKASKEVGREIEIPALHFVQVLGLALGLEPLELGFNHNITPVKFI